MALFGSILNLLYVVSSVATLISFFRPGRLEGGSPFEVIQLGEIYSRLSSPLQFTPPKIHRQSREAVSPGLAILAGTNGVGKSREAADMATELGKISGASYVYFARGYVEPSAPLPSVAEVRRVIVIIDDYDWGFQSAASNSFVERHAAQYQVAIQLKALWERISKICDIHAMFVTVNSHRLPVSEKVLGAFLPQSRIHNLQAVSVEECRTFTISVAQMLGLTIEPEVLDILLSSSDGRFDSLAVFLRTLPKGTKITKAQAESFARVRNTVWKLFKNQLASEQMWVYEQAELLRDFGLPCHLDYLKAIAKDSCVDTRITRIEEIGSSIWAVANGEFLIYDGQFAPPRRERESAKRLMSCVLSMRSRRRGQRYLFQEEMKTLCMHLACGTPSLNSIRFLKRLAKWYPRDMFFAYNLARAYAERGGFYRAIFALYRVFKRQDIRGLFSGKWIEVQAHLFLTDLYQEIGMHKRPTWESHVKLEHEFRYCALLADLETPDVGADGYEFIGPSDAEKHSRESFRNDLRELGYQVPPSLTIDSRMLRAIVHHKYGRYLLNQVHREHDAIRHEEIVTQLMPDLGEAFLNCATACLQLGDAMRALEYLDKAEEIGPQQMHETTFRYMVSRERWRCYQDIGQISQAQHWFLRCVELAESEHLQEDRQLRESLLSVDSNPEYWEFYERLARTREKKYTEVLSYRVPSLRFQLNFPPDWKVDKEWMSGEDEIELFVVVFSSQVAWDYHSRCPRDASIDILYTKRSQDTGHSLEEFGTSIMKQMNTVFRGRVSWWCAPNQDLLSHPNSLRWDFHIKERSPKVGFAVVCELAEARVAFKVMCQTCARSGFWPLFERVSRDFLQGIAQVA